MPANRMNRDEFYAAVAPCDDARLRKILWTLYWRGNAQLRERIEDELRPPEKPKMKPRKELPDPGTVLDDVTTFVTLVKDGAYMAGDRRVHHTERSKWRLTFRRLAGDALAALRADDPGPAQQAVAEMVDLACEPGWAASLRLRVRHFRKPCSSWISRATIWKSHQSQKHAGSALDGGMPGCPARPDKRQRLGEAGRLKRIVQRHTGSVVDHQRADTVAVTYSSTAPGICR